LFGREPDRRQSLGELPDPIELWRNGHPAGRIDVAPLDGIVFPEPHRRQTFGEAHGLLERPEHHSTCPIDVLDLQLAASQPFIDHHRAQAFRERTGVLPVVHRDNDGAGLVDEAPEVVVADLR